MPFGILFYIRNFSTHLLHFETKSVAKNMLDLICLKPVLRNLTGFCR